MSVFKCIELEGRTFETKTEMFLAMKENKSLIIADKKINKTKSAPIQGTYIDTETSKSVEGLEKGFIYPVINTTNYMDSHNDVHFDGIWNKSIKEQKGKIHYTTDHELKISSIIAYPKDVELMVKEVSFESLGYKVEGNTEALIFKTNPQTYSNPQALKIITDKIDIQHSVRMEYVKMVLCVDSDDKELKEEKANFDKYVSKIVNKDHVTKQGFFWGVQEAKIVSEGSMVVNGSNDVTPLLYSSDESHKSTQESNEPSENDIQEKERLEVLRRFL